MSDQDTILLSRLKAGDDKAFEVLFKKYYKVLSVQAFYLLGDDMEAEDLVQSVFISFWRDGRCYDIKTSVKAYLQRAVHNHGLNILEKRNRLKRSLDYYRNEYVDPCTQPDLGDDSGEPYLNAALRSLPVQQGEAFHLVHMEDKKYKEAAEAMGISVNSVKTHLKLAVKNLRARIKRK